MGVSEWLLRHCRCCVLVVSLPIMAVAAESNGTDGGSGTPGLHAGNAAAALGRYDEDRTDLAEWADVIQVAEGARHSVGRKADGTAVASGDDWCGQTGVTGWNDLIQVAAGVGYTVGLKSDGTAVAIGANRYGQTDVAQWMWSALTRVSTGWFHTVGLKADGTVVAVGLNNYGQTDVADWNGVTQIAAGGQHTVGLKGDGTAIAVGDNRYRQCEVAEWRDLVQIVAGGADTVGLRRDGSLVKVGRNNDGEGGADFWKPNSAIPYGIPDPWDAAYRVMLEDSSTLGLLRSYRDQVLMRSERGRHYTELVYSHSEEALNVLLDNPRLMILAGELIELHRDALAAALEGEPAEVRDAGAVVDFLKNFAEEAPPVLGVLTIGIAKEVSHRQRAGGEMFGFTLR
jgi:hypothetical protein